MDEMTCPKCGNAMNTSHVGDAVVTRCSSCGGLFLDRADVGVLSEAENDWHRGVPSKTEPLPRITSDMTAPPPARPRARSFLETLFNG